MPQLDDIESFKHALRSLAKEDERLSAWGESYEDLPVPDQSIPGDLTELLEPAGSDSGALAADPEAEAFTDFLSGMSLDEPLTPSGPPDLVDTPAEPDEFGPSLPGIDALSEPEPFPDGASGPEEAGPSEEAALLSGLADELETAGPDGDLGTFDLPSLDDEVAAQATGYAPSAEAGPPGGSAGAMADPGEIGDFDFPETNEEPAAAASPAEPAPPASDDFSIPDFGADIPADAFDSFNLDGETAPPESPAGFGAGPEAGLPADIEGQMESFELEAHASDTFNLESSWGEEFNIPGFEMNAKEAPPLAAPAVPARPMPSGRAQETRRPASDDAARPVNLSDAQVEALQDTLLSFPLNLRLAVEGILANAQGSEAQQSRLVWMLAEGAAPKDAAIAAGKILKRYIQVPPGFEKRTGAAFEARKGSMAYIFIHTVLPILEIVVASAIGLGVLAFMGYNFVYKPLWSNYLYGQGFKRIEREMYRESEEIFVKADAVWIHKGWYYKYAEAYVEKENYIYAERTYQRLLFRWPKETRAALDFARMKSERQLEFDAAEAILSKYVLSRDYFNNEGLLLSGDNYLAWADALEQRYEDPDTARIKELYESARKRFAMAIEHHGRTDAYLERMLKYFMRTERFTGRDETREILPLKSYLLGNKKSAFSAETLAELGAWLIDRNLLEDAERILLMGVDRDGAAPEPHYQLSRYYDATKQADRRRTALKNAVTWYGKKRDARGLDPRGLQNLVDSYMRLGEDYMGTKEFVPAEESLGNAIELYERSLEDRRFKKQARFGKAYALLADIFYFSRNDLDGALALYLRAEAHDYATPDTRYRKGFIYYHSAKDELRNALFNFYESSLDRNPSPYLALATADTLFRREDWFAAQGYYRTLVDRMQFELSTLGQPRPQEKASHMEVVELLMIARNNLGVALYQAGNRLGDSSYRSEGMREITEASRLFDSIARDQKTMLRPETPNLSNLNLDLILRPRRGIDLAIYPDIPRDMKFPQD